MAVRPVASLVLAALALADCEAGTEPPLSAPAATGRLRFMNASPDTRAAAVNVRIDGLAWVANQGYKAATGYVLVLPGQRQIDVRKTADPTVVVLSQAVTVAASTDYTVMATGLDPDLAALILTDDNSKIYIGGGSIRVVNASPTMGAADVYITAPGADLTTSTPVATSLAYRAAAGYFGPFGSAQVRFTTPGTTTVVLTGPTLTLVMGQIRTVVALDAGGGGTPLTSVALTDR